MVRISNNELDSAVRLLTRLVELSQGDETRDRETRRQAVKLVKSLSKRKASKKTRQTGVFGKLLQKWPQIAIFAKYRKRQNDRSEK